MKKIISILILSLLSLFVLSNDEIEAQDSCLVNQHNPSEEEGETDDISCPLESVQANVLLEKKQS